MDKKRRRAVTLAVAAALLLALAAGIAWYFNLLPAPSYTAADFGIATLASGADANGNGADDDADILAGARMDAENHPRYDPAYVEGGYPADDAGVCSDVIWRALAHAGYDLKALIDADIADNPEAYPGLDAGGPDPNIDFRRVCNLSVYLARHCQSLTTDLSDIAQWQPGDIVVFAGVSDHIGILSDKRNASGVPWLIHNSGQPRREEDAIEKLLLTAKLTGHYRWAPPA